MKILAWCFGMIYAQMCAVDMMESLTKCPGMIFELILYLIPDFDYTDVGDFILVKNFWTLMSAPDSECRYRHLLNVGARSQC